MSYKNRMQFNASYGNQLAHIKEDSYFSVVLSYQCKIILIPNNS
ncbi:hypothetical protein J503_4081 [Acinetobacter baumannii 984213]|nr:hypothetical protein ACIN5143_A0445 [Acinetobacter baumannii OIFC143]EXA56945.1 hypothetical protein J503_4081 [Acinetobacter baumannii 984213]EXB21188.1 hypothetical protein J535_0959 [Acinetobacter baumannii 1429530]